MNIIKDGYKNSCAQVICGNMLTIQCHSNSASRLGAHAAPLTLYSQLTGLNGCVSVRSPNPEIHSTLLRTEQRIQWSGLDVNHTKCAAFRRSGKNPSLMPPAFSLNNKPIHLHERHEAYH